MPRRTAAATRGPSSELAQTVGTIAALDDPVRRQLYLYLKDRFPAEVTRDEAARALEVPRSVAAFHLDKLVDVGMAEISFRRLSGRTGPGAGRPSKLYRRAMADVEISLPHREYALAAELMARAIPPSETHETYRALQHAAHQLGKELGQDASRDAGAQASPARRFESAIAVLERHGYEPVSVDGEIRLRNCPFHALAQKHRDLVCHTNLSLMGGLAEGVAGSGLEPSFQPRPGMCCVAFKAPRHSAGRTRKETARIPVL